MKTNITLTSLLLTVCFFANAQTVSPDNRIVVLGQATVNVPADQAKFYITLESVDSTNVEKVYQKHQVQEQKLVKLLQGLNLPSSDITYSLFSVSKRQDYVDRKRSNYYVGRQNVLFTISSLENLSSVQSQLIKEGFTNFNSVFTSTKFEQHQSEAIQNAINAAKNKAEVMAKAADRKIKRIVKIGDTEETDPTIRTAGIETVYQRSDIGYRSSDLLSFPQTIPVTASVKVVFELK